MLGAAATGSLFGRGPNLDHRRPQRRWNASGDQDYWHEHQQSRFETPYFPVPQDDPHQQMGGGWRDEANNHQMQWRPEGVSSHMQAHTRDLNVQSGPNDSGDANGDLGYTETDAFKRAEIRASVFDTYAICSALFAGFSCSQPSFSATSWSELETLGMTRVWVMHLQQWTLYLCTAGGVYATIIFTFCALYSKTALAQPKDGLVLLDNFLKETGAARMYAFYSMYFTTLGFSASLVLNIFQQFQPSRAIVAVIPLIIVLTFTIIHSRRLIHAAGPIFAAAAAAAAANKPATPAYSATETDNESED